MRKRTQNYVLFVILFLLGLFQAVSGFIMWLALPHARRGGGGGDTFWALTRDEWRVLHDWVSVVLVLIVIIHLILHWKWITHMTKSYFTGVWKQPEER